MEKLEQELLEKIVPINPELRQLYNRHRKLEKEVERFGRYAAYSSSAALKHQELKKEKLRDKDRIIALLKAHETLNG